MVAPSPPAEDAPRPSAHNATALTRFGIKPDDLQTTNLTLNRIDYGKDRGRFQASNNVTVRLRDLSKASEAIVATTEAGANLLSGPTLRVSDAEKASLSVPTDVITMPSASNEVSSEPSV